MSELIKTAQTSFMTKTLGGLQALFLLTLAASAYGSKKYMDRLAEDEDKRNEAGPPVPYETRVKIKYASTEIDPADLRTMVALTNFERDNDTSYLKSAAVQNCLASDGLEASDIVKAVKNQAFEPLLKTATWEVLRLPFIEPTSLLDHFG